MIVYPALLVAALSALDVVAFVPNSRSWAASYQIRHRETSLCASSWFGPIRTPKPPAAKPPDEEGSTFADDVSIPYDAAALLAYDDWRARFSKGDFDEERFSNFKANYEAIAVANVIAKRKAREAGENAAPALLSLNEFADCTAEEYQAKRSGSTGDVLGKAFEAAQSQSEASSALAEAAEALAEEEELLAKQLGLESVDELEVALDSLEGIAADGGELEKENIAREARIRSAYLEWCKENGKEPVEARYLTFASNFLAMENYSRESGREMSLNKYADCTEDEYLEATGQKQKEEVKADEETKIAETPVAQVGEDSGRQSRAEAEALAKAEAKAKVEAEKKAKEEELAKKKAAQEAWQKMTDDERKAAADKEREERRAAQIKALEKLRQENEAAAIAAAKAEQEREAAQVAARREIDRKAAEIVRQKAREYEEKQKLVEKSKLKAVATPKKKAFEPLSFFASSGAKAKPVEKKVEETQTFDVSSLLGGLAPTPPPQPKKQDEIPNPLASIFSPPPVTKKEAKPTKKDAAEGFSFFTQLTAPAKATPTPKAVVKPATKPAQVQKPVVVQKPATVPLPAVAKPNPFSFFAAAPAPKPSPKITPPVEQKKPPVAPPKDAFSFFGGFSAPKPPAAPAPVPPPPVKATVRPAPVPAKAKAVPRPVPAAINKGSFSFFTPKPAPAPKEAPAPPAPAPKKEPFSLFGAPKPAPAPKVAPTPPVPKKEPFSFFGAPKPVAKAAVPKVAPSPPVVATPKEPFSFFGAPKPVVAKPPAPAKSAPKKPEPKKVQKQVAPPKESVAARQVRGTISLTQLAKEEAKQSPFSFFGPKAEAKDDIPVLSRWIQNDDGSITGFVSNSKNFRDNTRITTSPVRIGVKEGQVVKTGSGSQYRLN